MIFVNRYRVRKLYIVYLFCLPIKDCRPVICNARYHNFHLDRTCEELVSVFFQFDLINTLASYYEMPGMHIREVIGRTYRIALKNSCPHLLFLKFLRDIAAFRPCK